MVAKKFDTGDKTIEYEIMIVGGGPAGISTWLHLHKYAPDLASQTVVIEKAAFPRDKLCGGGLGSWCSDIFKHLQIELDIPSLFISDVEFKCGGEFYHLFKPNYFQIVQRMDFDHALVKIALNRGLKLHEDEKLIDIIPYKNNLTLYTNKRKYRVQALIGADGALSIVRRKLMRPQKTHLAPTIQFFSPTDPELDSQFKEKKIILNLDPIIDGLQGYIWHVPCLKSGTPTIANGICDFRLHRDKPRADMKEIFRRELQVRQINAKPKSWLSHPIHWLSMEEIIAQQNVILVGDAAGIEPAFGGGIHIALSYGEIAAHNIIDAFKKGDFTFKDYKKSLKSHFMGKWIDQCTRNALDMYGGRKDPLEVARELFPESQLPSDLVSKMVSEIAKTLLKS